MVGRGHGELGAANLATGQTQALEGLGAGDFVNQLQIDVEDRLLSGLGRDDMLVPDFGEHRSRLRFVDHRFVLFVEEGGRILV